MSFSTWITFFVVVTLIAYTPGPMTLFSMSSSVRYGFVRTLPAISGGSLAYIIQMIVVYFGLGAVVNNSAVLFGIIKWSGVAYLLWLGWLQWRSTGDVTGHDGIVREVSAIGRVCRGFITGMSNPKSILVFTALFPQFINPAQAYSPQFLTMCLTFFVMQGSSAISYALFGARVFAWLRKRRKERLQGRVTGAVLFVAGGVLAVSER